MKCDISKEKIHLLHDGLLEEEERKQIARHISKCEECRQELEYLDSLAAGFGEMESYKIDEILMQKLLAIDKNSNSVVGVIKDVRRILKNSTDLIFHTTEEMEDELSRKYNKTILRWVFFC